MLKVHLLFLFCLIFSACALEPGTIFGRGLASSESQCSLVKHPRENIYQVRLDGRPYSEFWYDHSYGERLMQRLRTEGKCTN